MSRVTEQRRTTPPDFRVLGAELRTWGRWGIDDRLGTLNLLDDAARAAAAALVRNGRVVALGLPFDERGPQGPHSDRDNVRHIMTRTGDQQPTASGYVWNDDRVELDLQSGSQLDGLAHVGYDGLIYGGRRLSAVTAEGARELGIEAMIGGIQGRGVLLDIPRHRGVDRLEADAVVDTDELIACAAAQRVEVRVGDCLLIRTGWIRTLIDDHDPAGYLAREPGLALETARWLHDRGVALVGSDNFGIEVAPAEDPAVDFPLHCVLLRDMGMPLAEILVLEELARVCEDESRWEFLFTCSPLPVVGAVGSPVAPLATF